MGKPKRPTLRLSYNGLTEHFLSEQARHEHRQAQIDTMRDEAKDG